MPLLRGGGGRARAAQGARLGVVVASLRVGLAPALLVAAALISQVLSGHRQAARVLCILATLAASALVLMDLATVGSGGHLDLALGEQVPGLGLNLRLDAAGTVIVSMAAIATLAALLGRSREATASGALMVCLAGAVLTALASNVISLFAGAEIGNIGALLFMTAGRRRLGRGALLFFAIEHMAALGLLAAALELQLTRGTGDIGALAASPLPTSTALIWALSGAAALAAVWGPSRHTLPDPRVAWSSVAAAPIGVAILVRLAQASGGDLSTTVAAALAIAGVAVALAGVSLAVRRRQTPGAVGRALCLTGAGYVVAAAGITGDSGRSGFAAVAVFLEVTLITTPAWCGLPGELAGRRRRWFAALALAGAGGLPIGFGTTALLLEMGAAASNGPDGVVLLAAQGVAAVIAAAAACLAVRHLMSGPAADPESALPWGTLPAIGFSMAAAIVPGVVLTPMVSALAGGEGASAADAGAVTSAGGGWPGGYIALAVLAVLAFCGSIRVLVGARPLSWGPQEPYQPGPAGVPTLKLARSARTGYRRLRVGVRWLDHRLVTQPQLLVVVAALAVTVFLFR